MLNILIFKKGMWAFARVAACLLAAAAHFHLNPVRTLLAPHYAVEKVILGVAIATPDDIVVTAVEMH